MLLIAYSHYLMYEYEKKKQNAEKTFNGCKVPSSTTTAPLYSNSTVRISKSERPGKKAPQKTYSIVQNLCDPGNET